MSGRIIMVKKAGETRGLACGKTVREDKGRRRWFKAHMKYCEICKEAGEDTVILRDPVSVNEVLQGPVIGFVDTERGWAVNPAQVPLELCEFIKCPSGYPVPDRTLWEQMYS